MALIVVSQRSGFSLAEIRDILGPDAFVECPTFRESLHNVLPVPPENV